MADDPLIAQHEGEQVDDDRARRAANLFDLRRIIGALFLVYGLILFVLGLGASDAEIEKAAGWNLNLWVGVAMLIVGGLFVLWAFTRPLADALEDDGGGGGAPGGDRGPDAAEPAGSQAAGRGAGSDRPGGGGQGGSRRE